LDCSSIFRTVLQIDAAKHIGPDSLAATCETLKSAIGGEVSENWFAWPEILIGGEADSLVQDSGYSFTTHFDGQLKWNGRSDKEIEQVKFWSSAYSTDVDSDEGRLTRVRKVIQNDDHDQQSPGSNSRDMHDQGRDANPPTTAPLRSICVMIPIRSRITTMTYRFGWS
jgi:alpha-amylase